MHPALLAEVIAECRRDVEGGFARDEKRGVSAETLQNAVVALANEVDRLRKCAHPNALGTAAGWSCPDCGKEGGKRTAGQQEGGQ